MGFLRRLQYVLSGKAITTADMMPIALDNQPIYHDWSTAKAVKEGYRASNIVYACVNKTMELTASVPWRVQTRRGDSWQDRPDHPLQVLINAPNPKMSRRYVFEVMIGHLLLGGNAIWSKVRDSRKQVRFLWPIGPDGVLPVPSQKDFISHYVYERNGRKLPIPYEDIVHFQFADPGNPYWGLAPLQAGAKIVDLDSEAVDWNKVSFQNRGVVAGVLSFDSPLTDAAYQRARKAVKENVDGSGNAYRVMVLDRGASYSRMALTQQELDFIQSRKMTAQDICTLFQMPPPMVGIYENATLANIETARKIFWLDRVVPLLDSLQSVMWLLLVPEFGNPADLRLSYDLSGVDAVQREMLDKIESAQKLYQMDVPFNDINERLKLGFGSVSGGDIPASLKLPVQPIGKAMLESKATWDEETKTAFWRAFEDDRVAWEKRVASEVAKRFEAEGRKVAAAYEASGHTGAANAVTDEQDAWERLYDAVYQSSIEHFGKLEANRIAGEVDKVYTAPEAKADFSLLTQAVRHFIATYTAQKVTRVLDTTKSWIAGAIKTGLDKAETTPQIAKRITKLYHRWGADSELEFPRSMTIARTEVGAAANFGHQEGARQAAEDLGVTLTKEWISSRDSRVREAHREVDGEVRDMDKAYSNGLMYPGDPSGPASELVNCRCVQAQHVEE